MTHFAIFSSNPGQESEFSDEITFLTPPPPPPPPWYALGELSDIGSEWHVVTLPHAFQSPVVLCTLTMLEGQLPASAQVRRAHENQFEVRVIHPKGQPLSGYSLRYWVVEEGTYTVEQHEIQMEARRVRVETTQNRWNRTPGLPVIPDQTYHQPVVLGQIEANQEEHWSSFWTSSARFQNPPALDSIQIGRFAGEDTNLEREPDFISIVILEAGTGVFDDIPFEVGLTADSITGHVPNKSIPSHWVTYPVSPQLIPEMAFISMNGMDSSEGGWAVLVGSDSVTEAGIRIAIDEDTCRDEERWHTSEQVGYLVLASHNPTPTHGKLAHLQPTFSNLSQPNPVHRMVTWKGQPHFALILESGDAQQWTVEISHDLQTWQEIQATPELQKFSPTPRLVYLNPVPTNQGKMGFFRFR